MWLPVAGDDDHRCKRDRPIQRAIRKLQPAGVAIRTMLAIEFTVTCSVNPRTPFTVD